MGSMNSIQEIMAENVKLLRDVKDLLTKTATTEPRNGKSSPTAPYRPWTDQEDDGLIEARGRGITAAEYGRTISRSESAVHRRTRILRDQGRIPQEEWNSHPRSR